MKISFDAALSLLADEAAPLGSEMVAQAESDGRRLCATLVARIDGPRHDCAAMDGYAIDSANSGLGLTRFRLVGARYAGDADAGRVMPGEAMRITTGARLPEGADRVIVSEQARAVGTHVMFDEPLTGKPHVRARGSDFRTGDTLIEAGAVLTPQRMIAAAAADLAVLPVCRQPTVRIIATGDELSAPGEAGALAGAIPDSLSAGVAAMARRWGAVIASSVRTGDDLAAIAGASAAPGADVLLLIGGASRGDRDFSRRALGDLGLRLVFSEVAIRPGKPVWYGRLGDRHVLGLPGNPTAALTVARLFLSPLLTALGGGVAAEAFDWKQAAATVPLEANGSREAFLCAFEAVGGIHVIDRQQASSQAMLARTTGFVRRAPGAPPVDPGDEVSFLAL